jgi:N-acetyl-alpha-D-muramate 1-phosphate uridylyltransferase
MLLAAGLGLRMRPLTLTTPKPLVKLAGRALLDYVLDRLLAAGVETVVINVHYLPQQIIDHVASRKAPKIVISDESGELLDTGGGVSRVLAQLGSDPFYIVNADSISIPGGGANLARMAAAFDPARMDCLMLLATAATSLGYDGNGDFHMGPDGHLKRRREREITPFAFTGTSLAHPRMFEGSPSGKFSLNTLWDRTIESGRLFGIRQDGLWMHIGSPEALAQAERLLATGESYF